MKIALIADYYSPYIEQFDVRVGLAELRYQAHVDALVDDYFGSFGSYRNHLRKLGHECELLVGNYFRLQTKWLRERGIREPAEPASKHSVVLRQLEELRPDVVFVSSMFDYFGDVMRKISRITSAVFVWIACPYPARLDFSGVRCVVSSAPTFIQAFRRRGLRVEQLDAAFDADILDRVGAMDRDLDVTFMGGLSRDSHAYRLSTLESLVRQDLNIQVWGYGLTRARVPFLRSPVERVYRGEAWGLDYYRALARSKVTLNLHVDVAKRDSIAGNIRVYEATGCGACLLTDWAPSAGRLFVPDQELLTFASREQLLEKLRLLLRDDTLRSHIARAGQRKCLDQHSYPNRMRALEAIFLGHA